MSAVVGIDTSNYTTSVAVFNGTGGENCSILLRVGAGELGLRQSEALFQHVKNLPNCFSQLSIPDTLCAIGVSTRPRAVSGSYMPCFLAGASHASSLAHVLDIPYYEHSHQQGHLAAAAWSAGQMQLLDQPFLAWHLSGGTTELLKVTPKGTQLCAACIGGSSDISAGQLIDRAGVRLGLPFPAGRALDELSRQGEMQKAFPVKVNNLTFSLSGMENKVNGLLESGANAAHIASFAIATVTETICRVTGQALLQYPALPVLCSGGVAANSYLRGEMVRRFGAYFAQPKFSTDNAMGTAILTWRRQKEGAGYV